MNVWFITGSQSLYGEETLRMVEENSKKIVSELDTDKNISVKILYKEVLKTPEAIYNICQQANADNECIGLISWMHTFSPAKMWISGLKNLSKPLLHLHTQFNRNIPWNEIDMDFMNLNQSAHGGREYGFINSRMRKNRKVVVGHWQDEEVIKEIDQWIRVAKAWQDAQNGKIARFGDNMREVAVTEGDKVEAQMQFGYTVHGFGLGDLVDYVSAISDAEISNLIQEYKSEYIFPKNIKTESLKDSARIELGIKAFLQDGEFTGFTSTFENLTGLKQLPGLAVQRLMAEGYGFGAEGDWKTAALVRAVKVMSEGLTGGTSFMEDYTYHLEPGKEMVLGAHMLEVCPSIAGEKPKLEIHPLSIGGKEDPARLVFGVNPGKAINASIIDLGNRFRLIINNLEVVAPQELPKLPVARVLWKAMPDFKTAAQAWILAGGAHHSCFSKAINKDYMIDFAEIAGIESILIDEKTNIQEFKKELRNNEVFYHTAKGFTNS